MILLLLFYNNYYFLIIIMTVWARMDPAGKRVRLRWLEPGGR